MNRFDGKTVLITGGARGQGAAHARAFVAEGAKVFIGDVREEQGRALAGELGADAAFMALDVTKESDWAAAVAEAESRFGSIDVLINNAGILAPARTIADANPADWDLVIDTNLKGMFLGIRAVAPSLKRSGGGAIVNIASNQGHVGTANFAGYVVSKWGVRGLTRTAALELARDGVRVNSISPGVVDTQLITEPVRPGEPAVADNLPLDPLAVPRMADPTEISRLVLFLASDDAAFVTGSEYLIDGGMLLGPVPAIK